MADCRMYADLFKSELHASYCLKPRDVKQQNRCKYIKVMRIKCIPNVKGNIQSQMDLFVEFHYLLQARIRFPHCSFLCSPSFFHPRSSAGPLCSRSPRRGFVLQPITESPSAACLAWWFGCFQLRLQSTRCQLAGAKLGVHLTHVMFHWSKTCHGLCLQKA